MRAFEAWRDSLETVPTIKALRNKAENIRAAEVRTHPLGVGAGVHGSRVGFVTVPQGLQSWAALVTEKVATKTESGC